MAILENASNFMVNGNLIDNSQAYNSGLGLAVLLKASYPEAGHDSSSHPLSCFSGTRVQYIKDITGWGLTPATKRHFRMLWMEGPAGVGKSSVVQSCAEKVGGKLAAAFFFSRQNSRDNSACLFPSIAHQLATKYPTYRDKLDRKIFYNPSLVNKSIDVQFRELIVTPLQEMQSEGQTVHEGIIFVDGLDECAGEEAQCATIDIISTSVRDQTTPFIWAFSSRPEPPIVARFTAPQVHNLCWKLTLPVSHDADGDVERYLQDGFRGIRAKYGFPPTASWPSKGDIREVVRRSKGLFIYPASVVCFVGEGGTLGPEEQLRLVLALPSELASNPWSHLDAFYTLIMKGIPEDMLTNALKLLSLACVDDDGRYYIYVTNILGLSPLTYCAALSKLHSVAKLMYDMDGSPKGLKFYHASFVDFLWNPERSGRFCIKGPENCASLLADLIGFFNRADGHRIAHLAFWKLGSYAKLDESLLQQLSTCDYRNMCVSPLFYAIDSMDVERFFNNIPPERHKMIMRRCSLTRWQKLFRGKRSTEVTFILGRGDKKRGLELLSDDRKCYHFCEFP